MSPTTVTDELPAPTPSPITYTTYVEQMATKTFKKGVTRSRRIRKDLELRFSPYGEVNGRPSLFARRATSNMDAMEASSSSRNILPNARNTIDLVTPPMPRHLAAEPAVIDLTTPPRAGSGKPLRGNSTPPTAIDSGYISGSCLSQFKVPERLWCSSAAAAAAAPAPAPRDVTTATSTTPAAFPSICQYRSGMHGQLDVQFYNQVVRRQFRYDPSKARKDLAPIMRRILEKPEDRPMVSRNYLILNLKTGTIKGESRTIRKPAKKSGQRRCMAGASEEMTSYFQKKVGYE